MTDDPLTNKPLPHLNELFPAVQFMEITDKRDGSKTIVGTRQDVRGRALFVEVDMNPEVPDQTAHAVEIAHYIDAKLHKKVIQANTRSDGSVITRMIPSLPGAALNRAQRRASEGKS